MYSVAGSSNEVVPSISAVNSANSTHCQVYFEATIRNSPLTGFPKLYSADTRSGNRFAYGHPFTWKVYVYFELGQHVAFNTDFRFAFLVPERRNDPPIAEVGLGR